MIKEKELILKRRSEPIRNTKYNSSKSYVVNEKTKAYEYFICDYCGGEIEIKENRQEQTGGTIEFKGMELALHNKCLKAVIKEYE